MVEKILIILFVEGFVCACFDYVGHGLEVAKYKLSEVRRFMEQDDYIDRITPESFAEHAMVHVARLLQAAFFIGNRAAVTGFFILSFGIAAVLFFISFRVVPIYLSVVIFAASCFLPYLLLLGQVQAKRVSSSLEGEILVTELLNNYKINYCNMRQAVEITALTIAEAPNSKKLLFNLAKGLNNAAEGKNLERLVEEFRFAIGTSWAGILSANIYMACQSGLRVTESLADLAASMRMAREVAEFSRRENNEAFIILKYLIPLSALMMTAGAILLFDMSITELINYQFRTRAGITWFALWLVLYLFAAAVNVLLTKRKFDL